MIPRKFVPPNFICHVRLAGLQEIQKGRLERATDEQELRARLIEAGHEVLEIAPYDFKTWLEKAKVETEEAIRKIEAKEDYEFKGSVWGNLREYLFRCFDGKCAYCEGKKAGVTPGSVEHYRPKGKVSEDEDHPGYYWLAYDVHNYLPGCTACNGKKSNHFPLKEGSTRGSKATGIAGEIPLLLNPYMLSDPSTHLSFQIIWTKDPAWEAKLVVMKAVSEEGKKSIACLDLNREGLLTERASAINQALLAYKDELLQKTKRIVGEIRSGRREFSAACAQGLNDFRTQGGLD